MRIAVFCKHNSSNTTLATESTKLSVGIHRQLIPGLRDAYCVGSLRTAAVLLHQQRVNRRNTSSGDGSIVLDVVLSPRSPCPCLAASYTSHHSVLCTHPNSFFQMPPLCPGHSPKHYCNSFLLHTIWSVLQVPPSFSFHIKFRHALTDGIVDFCS